MLRTASAQHQAGQLDVAEALYRKVLETAPEDPNALHLLGVIAYQRGDANNAIGLIGRALPGLPDVAELHANLGHALDAAGDPTAAAESYRRAIALQPDFPTAYAGLAHALNQLREHAAALSAAECAAALDPQLASPHVQMAVALTALDRLPEAGTAYQKALRIDPDQPAVLARFGLVLSMLDHHDAALICHRRAMSLSPDDAELHLSRGRSLMLARDYPAARDALRRATELKPDHAELWLRLGICLSTLGAFAAAAEAYRRVLTIDPDNAEALRALSAIHQPSHDVSELARLRRILASDDQPVEQRIAAGFAAGERLDRLDRCGEAFACFAAANALQRERLLAAGEGLDLPELNRYADELIEHCTPAFYAKARNWGNASGLPVLVVGMPRSGTTLVEQIAASHPQVVGAGELRNLDLAARRLMLANTGHPLAAWDPATARREADAYVAHLAALGGGATRVVDKMPDNVFSLGIAAAMLPGARAVLCRRDPRDIGLSCYTRRFVEGHAYSTDLAECARRALLVERLMAHWRAVLPIPVLELHYEAMVTDPEAEARRLIDFLGLSWDPACLRFHQTERTVTTASFWQVRQPLYTTAVGRWRRYEPHLGPLLEVLGAPAGDQSGARV
jgi:tetratricopeptide (TPR) repeat protein